MVTIILIEKNKNRQKPNKGTVEVLVGLSLHLLRVSQELGL